MTNRKLLLSFTTSLIITSIRLLAQNADSIWVVNNYEKQEVYIPMRDGIKLFTSIYSPKNKTEKSPILINRTPYSCKPYGKEFRKFWSNHYIEYAKAKYILVIQDVRGRYMSEGDFVDVRPFTSNKSNIIDEASDTYDAIDWLIKNTNNNGNAGVFGISYPGFYSTMAALSDHPVPYMNIINIRRQKEYMIDDQRFASMRPDVLSFSTETLNRDITLAGPVLANLITSISTTDADFIVKIIDVFPDDYYAINNTDQIEKEIRGAYQMLVRAEIFRGKYRKSFEKSEAFIPNQKENVDFSLPDIVHTFKKGHKIMEQIQSSWFPLFDQNPQQFLNIYQCNEKDFVPSHIKIWHQSDATSKIMITVE